MSAFTPHALPDIAARPPLDWGRIAALTAAAMDQDLGAIASTFVEHGAAAPTLVWGPTPDDLSSEPLRHLLAHWSSLTNGDRLPALQQIDPLDLRPALGYVMLIDVLADGDDFRYRLYGSTISSISGFDMTGKRLSEHPASAYVTEFSVATARAAVRRREPVYTARRPMGAQDTWTWERLLLPLVDDEDRVVRLLAATTPLGRNGQLIRAIY